MLMSTSKSNNWHWDEKNYGKWSQGYLTNVLKNIDFQPYSSPLTVDSIDFDGFTTVSMRKGAQIVAYEYEIKLFWSIALKESIESNCNKAKGVLEIKEFDTENLEDESYVLAVKINCHDTHSTLLKNLKTNYFALVKKALSNFTKDLKAHDASRASGDKAEVAKDVTKRENTLVVNQPSPSTGSASTWNVDGYHWEEKPMTKWSQEEIKNLLESKPANIDSLPVVLKEVEVTGESSVTIRKGSKVIYYDFVIKAMWEAENSKGNLEITNFNSAENGDKEIENPSELEVHVEARQGNLDKEKIKPEIVKRLNEYINKLKQK